MSFQDIAKFEKDNSTIRIHVFGCEMMENDESKLDHFTIAYKSKKPFFENVLDISLFIYEKHYYLVKDLGELLDKKRGDGYRRHQYFCFNCLSSFDRQSRLQHHETLCANKNPMIPSFPHKKLKFRDYWASLSPPYLVYYDLETYYDVIPKHGKGQKSQGSLKKLAELKPVLIGYFIKFTEEEVFNVHPELREFEKIKIFQGKDCITNFFEDLKKVLYQIHDKVRKTIPI